MKYYLIGSGNQRPMDEIGKEQFDRLISSKRFLLQCYQIETIFDILIENFIEFEESIVALTLRYMYSDHSKWATSQRNRLMITRRLANLLTSSRMYIDHMCKECASLDNQIADFSSSYHSCRRTTHSSQLGYRVMDALRNWTQHQGDPVHVLKYNSRRLDTDDGIFQDTRTIPCIDVNKLKTNGRYNKSVLAELEALAAKQADSSLDLRPLVRDYITGLFKIHSHTNGLLKENIKRDELTLHSTLNNFTSKYGADSTKHTSILARNDAGDIKLKEDLFTDFIEERDYLEKKNRSIKYASSIFASTAHFDPNDLYNKFLPTS